jgi:hypothetical protein
MKRFFQCILVALFLLNGIESIQAIEWQKDMDQALSEAKLQNKPVLLFSILSLLSESHTPTGKIFSFGKVPWFKNICRYFIA